MNRVNFPHRKKQRRQSAELRALHRAQRSNRDQLSVLDRWLGKNVGAVKERLRLSSQD